MNTSCILLDCNFDLVWFLNVIKQPYYKYMYVMYFSSERTMWYNCCKTVKMNIFSYQRIQLPWNSIAPCTTHVPQKSVMGPLFEMIGSFVICANDSACKNVNIFMFAFISSVCVCCWDWWNSCTHNVYVHIWLFHSE